jgi:hypothetical protein
MYSNQEYEMPNVLTQEKNFAYTLCVSSAQMRESNLQVDLAIKDFWNAFNINSKKKSLVLHIGMELPYALDFQQQRH